MKYSIIIPTHNHCDELLKPCLESVFRHTPMDQVQLIICAHGCTDNTSYYLQRLKNQFDRLGFAQHLVMLTHDAPLVFAAACNQGIRCATGDRLIILNTEYVRQNSLTHDWLHVLNEPFEQHAQLGLTYTSSSASVDTSHVPFDCVMLDAALLRHVGVLNEHVEHKHHTESEYCLQLLQAGFKIRHVGPTHASHHTPLDMGNMSSNVSLTTCVTISEVADKYAWLAHVNTEAPELFKEVISTNTYKLEPGHVTNRSVIDVGANLGMFSIMCAALGAPQVLACEPVSATHDLLTSHVDRAQLQDQIQCVRAAITGDHVGPIMMGMHADSGKNSLYDVGTHAELVPSITLADLVRKCDQPEILLKLDCEGAEYDILMDSEPHTFAKIQVIMMEAHGDTHPKHKGIHILHDRLTTLGFTQQDYQPYGIWWYDASGAAVSWEPMNMSIELWSK